MTFNDIAAKIAADKEAKRAAKFAASLAMREMLTNISDLIESHMTFDPDTLKVSANILKSDVPQKFWESFESNGDIKTRLTEVLNKKMYHDRTIYGLNIKVVCNSLHYGQVETEDDAYIWFSFQVEESYH